MTTKEQQERWDLAVRQYAEGWRRKNAAANRDALEAYRDEAEQFFELNVPRETRQAAGKSFDDFFREVGAQLQAG